jgi:DNA-binding FrmR family transcriptional regulator
MAKRIEDARREHQTHTDWNLQTLFTILSKMVQEDKDCPAILLQIAAVQSALNKVSQIMLEDHIETYIAKAIKEGRGEVAIQELKEALA